MPSEKQIQARLETILPSTSSQLEVDLLDAFTTIITEKALQTFEEKKDLAISYLYNPILCPENLLPYLAAFLSVDVDIARLTETQKRDAIAASFSIHQKKGTVGSIIEAVESLGYTLTEENIIEGQRSNNNIIRNIRGSWAQFTIKINDTIPTVLAKEIFRLVQKTAPLSRRLVQVDFQSTPLFYDGRINSEGQWTLFNDGTYTHGAINSENIIE